MRLLFIALAICAAAAEVTPTNTFLESMTRGSAECDAFGKKFAASMAACDKVPSKDGDKMVTKFVKAMHDMKEMALHCNVDEAEKDAQHMSCADLKSGFCGCKSPLVKSTSFLDLGKDKESQMNARWPGVSTLN